MGKIRRGILGGFSGKVGNVVGASWKGIAYMRALPLSVKNPRTLKQRTQRSRFLLATKVLKSLQSVIKSGWALKAKGCSAFNAAMSYTVLSAIKGQYPNFSVDYSKVLISTGNLTGAKDYSTDGYDKMKSNVLWTNNSGTGSAKADDVALIAVFNPTKNEIVTPATKVLRSTASTTMLLPEHWDGDNAHVYLGFIAEDGKEIADSVYLGQYSVRNK